jgi:hypothetical protein
MANPNKIRKIRSYNPHGFAVGVPGDPTTIDLHVRNANGAPLAATAVPIVEVNDEYWISINLKDFDFEVEDVIAIVDNVTPCPVYAEPSLPTTAPAEAPDIVDPPTVD